MWRCCLLTLCVLTLGSGDVLAQGKGKWYIKPTTRHHRGLERQICHDLVEQLNSPKNLDKYTELADFEIPNLDRRFSLPRWELVAPEDYRHYFNHYFEYEELNRARYERIVKMEKAIMDVDYDGRNETMLRMRFKDSDAYHNDASKQSAQEHERLGRFGHSADTTAGFIFSYKGDLYITTFAAYDDPPHQRFRRSVTTLDPAKHSESIETTVCQLEELR